MRYSTYFAFTHTCFFEWTSNPIFPRCTLAGAKIAVVIFVDTIDDIAQVMLSGQRLQLTEEFGFTEVTAVKIIDNVTFVLELMCLQGNHWNTHLTCNRNGLAGFFISIGRRRCYRTQSAFTQHIMSNFEQKSTVNST